MLISQSIYKHLTFLRHHAILLNMELENKYHSHSLLEEHLS